MYYSKSSTNEAAPSKNLSPSLPAVSRWYVSVNCQDLKTNNWHGIIQVCPTLQEEFVRSQNGPV